MLISNDLRSYTTRQLTLFARLCVAQGYRVDVSLSDRPRQPAAIALGATSVFLNPSRATLHDLVLCCEFIRSYIAGTFRGDRPPSGAVLERHREAMRKGVHDRFPALRGLPSVILRNPDALPDCTMDEVETDPLYSSDTDISFDTGGFANLFGTVSPGLFYSSGGEDFRAVLAAIKANYDSLPPLPAVPWVRQAVLPTRIDRGEDGFEHAAKRLVDAESARKSAQDMARCLRRRQEGRQRDFDPAPRTESGSNLDHMLLHDAYLALRTGQPAAVFQNSEESFTRHYRPEEHLYVIGLDLNSLGSGSISQPKLPPGLVLTFAYAFEMLGSPVAVIGYADTCISLDGGRKLYLHMPTLLKAPEETVEGDLVRRLANVHLAARSEDEREGALVDVPRQIQTLTDFARHYCAGRPSRLEDSEYTHTRRQKQQFKRIELYQFARSSAAPLDDHKGYWPAACRSVEETVEKIGKELRAEFEGTCLFPKELIEVAEAAYPEGFVKTAAYRG